MNNQEITVGAFCIHKTKWGKRGCKVIAFHNNSVVIKYPGGGYHGVPAKSLAVTTAAKALSAERNHYAGVKRG
ncbi:hypothetical protein [Serratia inhibens]|uniref:hypothetical protein n=1 Tax=Serratia inhibens TaxID=2338073 RepID=UPI0008097808|nr:hypothetical protein [Serratia inhibens]ANS42497.1 hypothetical protein Q5A_010185 [Serratia inhibens PRI-2C]